MEEELKQTPLHSRFVEMDADMCPFCGFIMSMSIEGNRVEHLCVRERVGVFDVSHMGEFALTGPNALPFLRLVLTNDAGDLVDGQIQYSSLPDFEGGTIDDLLVYRLAPDQFRLVVNACNIEPAWDWLHNRCPAGKNLTLIDVSTKTALIAVQGPLAEKVLAKLTKCDLPAIKYYFFRFTDIAGTRVLLSRTGYTGEDGFEIMCDADVAVHIWDSVFEAGQEFGIKSAGLKARDTLRQEAGMALYGHELDRGTSAIEAGLGYFVKLNRKNMIGYDRLIQDRDDPKKSLVGFRMIDRGIPGQDYKIFAGGEEIGAVTSGNHSFTLGYSIGMGFVPPEFTTIGIELGIELREDRIAKAKVVKMPFYRRPKKEKAA